MDQSFHDARTRYTKPKPTKIEYKFTKLERRLRRSPYAHALATPIRKSPACTTALPRFFLERFNLLAHPETGDAWIVPTGLNSKVPQGGAPDVADPAEAAWQAALEEASSGEEDPLEDDFAVDEEASLDEEAPLDEEAAPEGDSAANEKATLNEAATKHAPTHLSGTPKGVKTGASSYVLSRQTLFREFVNPASEYFKSEKRLFRMSDHGLARLTPALNRAVWRSDMDTVLLELMRRRVVEGLCYFSRLVESDDRRYITECKQWDDVMELKHKGCLLYLGPPAAGESPSSADYVPPRLSTMDILDDRYTHVIAHLARLREGCELMRHGSLFHLGRLATLSLQLMIWKLQGYMAWDQPKETTEETAAPPASGEGVSTGNGL
ncbi:hypothetical protein C8A05DRAFT_43348 [Staphylotrichum tortipilum]|uniref:Uncharacterized protein n=1 Tax=Staphylotrichum tortipilum TaxID=2831512 RepID=A0AAN6MM15_9PEZI|nr:hypothetical protein C8A05DRAFT_43348 [Staphylotrichum longicolle]